MNRKLGFTLIELLVYMAILGFIIVVAGKVFSDSTGMRVRTQNMTKATEIVNATAATLKEDIGRMGVKQWKEATNQKFNVSEKVYRNSSTNDFSSFDITKGATDEPDEIFFNTIDFNPNGEFLATREIRYFVNENKELVRMCRTIDGASNNECPDQEEWSGGTIIAANVEKFSLNPSIPGVPPANGTLASSIDAANVAPVMFSSITDGFSFRKRSPSPDILDITITQNVTNKITLSGFTRNIDTDDKRFAQIFLAKLGNSQCEEFEFFPGETYAISFDLPPAPPPTSTDQFCHMCLFQPGIDHITLGLRKSDSEPDALIIGVPDFVVFPPPVQTAEHIPDVRYQTFSVSGTPGITPPVTACISLTFAFYSQMVSGGNLEFLNFIVERKMDEVYHFATEPYDPNAYDAKFKAMAKAFELELSVNIRNEIITTRIVIPVPNNGVAI